MSKRVMKGEKEDKVKQWQTNPKNTASTDEG